MWVTMQWRHQHCDVTLLCTDHALFASLPEQLSRAKWKLHWRHRCELAISELITWQLHWAADSRWSWPTEEPQHERRNPSTTSGRRHHEKASCLSRRTETGPGESGYWYNPTIATQTTTQTDRQTMTRRQTLKHTHTDTQTDHRHPYITHTHKQRDRSRRVRLVI